MAVEPAESLTGWEHSSSQVTSYHPKIMIAQYNEVLADIPLSYLKVHKKTQINKNSFSLFCWFISSHLPNTPTTSLSTHVTSNSNWTPLTTKGTHTTQLYIFYVYKHELWEHSNDR